MNQDVLKKAAAKAALEYIADDVIIGVGTGSTVNFFIEELASIKHRINAAVASSKATTEYLKAYHIPVIDLNAANNIAIYIDGADEVNEHLQMVKGGGGALTGEKIVATCAKKFICIVDNSKKVDVLGTFPIAIEVIPMARSYVAREIVKLGGDPVYRHGFVTDYGNIILDIYNLSLLNPIETEEKLNNIVGIVSNGIFAKRTADVVLIAGDKGIEKMLV